MTTPFRFAVQLDNALADSTWTDSVREVESLGYSTVFVPDHFNEGLGPLAAMASAIAVTETLNVGSLVLDCDYRHPAVLARELATIDSMSEGRLEVGLGAGWMASDYEHSGIPMDAPKVRVDRMIEHATILRRLFTEESVTFDGEHYQIKELPGTPKPHGPDGPPFLIGGGARRVLRFAGSFAEIVGINPSIHSGEIDQAAAQDGMPDRIDKKAGWVAEGAAKRTDGRALKDLEINAWLAAAQVTEDRDSVGQFLGELFGVAPEVGLASPMALVGTAAQIADDLNERRDRWGYSYTVIPGDEARNFAPIVAELAGQ